MRAAQCTLYMCWRGPSSKGSIMPHKFSMARRSVCRKYNSILQFQYGKKLYTDWVIKLLAMRIDLILVGDRKHKIYVVGKRATKLTWLFWSHACKNINPWNLAKEIEHSFDTQVKGGDEDRKSDKRIQTYKSKWNFRI